MASRNPFSGETMFELDVHNILLAIDEECFVDYRESVAAWCAAPKRQFPKTLRNSIDRQERRTLRLSFGCSLSAQAERAANILRRCLLCRFVARRGD
jgi:hypothetical protein